MKSIVLLLCSIAVALAAKDVRLITKDGVESNTEGRVEVFLNGAWGQVCSTGFSSKDATVVCRTVNGNAQGIAISGEHGIGSDPITIGQLECNGGEKSVLECPFTSQSTCRSGTIAAVDCNQRLGATGSLGLEAGIIAGICISLIAVIGILALLGTCLWKNDLCCAGRQLA